MPVKCCLKFEIMSGTNASTTAGKSLKMRKCLGVSACPLMMKTKNRKRLYSIINETTVERFVIMFVGL